MAGKGKKKAGRVALSAEEKAERKEALSGESKAQKFVRLGNPRITKAIKAIKRIGHLSGPSYEYTTAQIEAIEKLLKAAVADTVERFQAKEKSAAPAIDLGSLS